MKRKFDAIDNALEVVKEDRLDIEILVEKLVEGDLAPGEKEEIEVQICETLRDIESMVRTLQRKASIYREMAEKKDTGDK